MEAVRTPEKSLYINETTQRYIHEGYYIYTCRRENLKSYYMSIRYLFKLNSTWTSLHVCKDIWCN
jgi:hypothetical protein